MADKTKEEIAAEKAAADAGDEETQEAVNQSEDLISKAEAAAIRIEEANKKHEALLAKHEQMKVEQTLGGTADAGSKEETDEEKEIAGAKKLLKGTGYDDMLDPAGP